MRKRFPPGTHSARWKPLVCFIPRASIAEDILQCHTLYGSTLLQARHIPVGLIAQEQQVVLALGYLPLVERQQVGHGQGLDLLIHRLVRVIVKTLVTAAQVVVENLLTQYALCGQALDHSLAGQ